MGTAPTDRPATAWGWRNNSPGWRNNTPNSYTANVS